MSNASLELGGDNWAAKDGNLLGYAVGDSSGKYVPREFTFTRGSNLAATRVAANGLIEKGRENLLLYSNSFNNWINSNTTETSGQSGYDGSSDAWLLEKSAASAFIYRSFSGSGVYSLSVYAKADTLNSIFLLVLASGGNGNAYFNLSTGVVDAFGNNAFDAQIEDVGGGWYRCSLIGSYTSISQVRIYPANNEALGDTSGSIYIQDAQLEQGLVATGYIETGATTVQAGLLEDEPRIDYTGGTGSLLLEPSRTNLIKQTEYFGDSQWLVDGVSLDANNITSPEGLQNAYKITDDTTTGYHLITDSDVFLADGVMRTWSVFVKKGTARYCVIGAGNQFVVQDNALIFDMEGGTYTSTGTSSFFDTIHDPINMGNGWYRIGFSSDLNSSSYNKLSIGVSQGATWSGNVSYTGDGSLNYYIFGAQVEEGSYPTSYIPNHSGGSVTRSADYVNKTGLGSSVFNNDNLTLFLDFDYNAEGREGSTTKYRIFSDSSQLGIKGINSSSRALQVLASGDFSGTINFNSANASRIKVALRITNGTCELFFNGVKDTETIDVSAAAPYNWDRIAILLDNSMNSSLNQCLGFPTALSDAQCSALTVEGLKEEILTSYIAAVDTLEDGAEARLDTYLQNLEDLIV